MAIDRQSNGIPEVDLHRRTTKVNLVMIVGVGLFYLLTFGLLWWFSH